MAEAPKLLINGWLSGTEVPSSCSCGNSPDFYNELTGVLYTCMNEVYVPLGGSTGGPVTSVGPLTIGTVVVGAGGTTVQSGSPSQLVPTLTGNVNQFLNGTGAFSSPIVPFVIAAGAFSGGGSALVAGSNPGVSLVYCAPVVRVGTATAWSLTVDTGTAGIRVWRIAAGTAVPTVANSITPADLAISTGTNLRSTSFANFSGAVAPTFAVGDIIAIQLNTVATATYVAFSLVGQ